MIQQILDGITNAIYNGFGDDYNIYVEPEEQGINEPCFFVSLVRSKEDEKTMGRFLQKNKFHITYFPKTEEQARQETGYYDPNLECYDTLKKLNEILRYVTIEDESVVRGTNLEGEVKEKRLSFYVDYDLYVSRYTQGIAMDSLSQSTRKK